MLWFMVFYNVPFLSGCPFEVFGTHLPNSSSSDLQKSKVAFVFLLTGD